ncbi:1-acyl-sn-glycerol-3-phosphate acyltransferase [Cyanobium sp. Morenito 9A2]|uniref:1-acyl-sn-glycerol-3-phosphate acyltransferase n=1 Tax=Cyanobium sp. Morenito 9A2 TaxID=2823718 RepID=UPI0020CF0A0C|nr:1-acyl-sn-glycerol-3-phosphate acyltransferase [Cyanobium sp. Morenito 9A2]MCP9851205.1 1-acyl-sn-glycerol-3-phosphate acyltransferase [Cyanobium sp. Morenito 9A2]
MLAQAPLDFLPQRLLRWLPWLLRPLLPLLLRLQAGLVGVEADHLERLVAAAGRFQRGEARLLLAFRHPQTSDPYCFAALLWALLPRAARAQGQPLRMFMHSHFLYDRGIPLWAGPSAAWLLARLGGSSIQRGKLDLKGLRAARQLMVEGAYPLAAAPEGATNGLSDVLSPLEPGVAQIAFWAVEDLAQAGRSEAVELVPLGIRYHYVGPIAVAADRELAHLEQACGLATPGGPPPGGTVGEEGELAALYPRLTAVADWLLARLEQFYRQGYRASLASEGAITADNRGERLRQLLEAALAVSEARFGLIAKGSLNDRCRRIEQAGWDWIYRPDTRDRAALPAVERGLADHLATDAERALWHMRLVESFVAVSGTHVREKPCADRFGETLQILFTLVHRLIGEGPMPSPPRLGLRRAQISVGEAIDVGERRDAYRAGRQGAVATLTQDLAAELQTLIEA